jgi:hypothetical protein
VTRIVYARDATSGFDAHDTLLKETLAPPCPDNRFAVCLWHARVRFDLLFKLAFPDIEIITGHNTDLQRLFDWNRPVSLDAFLQRLAAWNLNPTPQRPVTRFAMSLPPGQRLDTA